MSFYLGYLNHQHFPLRMVLYQECQKFWIYEILDRHLVRMPLKGDCYQLLQQGKLESYLLQWWIWNLFSFYYILPSNIHDIDLWFIQTHKNYLNNSSLKSQNNRWIINKLYFAMFYDKIYVNHHNSHILTIRFQFKS